MARGVLDDPPVVDQLDRDRVEEMKLLPAGPLGDDEPGLLQHAQVLHDSDSRHVHLGFELAQGASFALEELVEQEAPS